jgi:hypothetical protein
VIHPEKRTRKRRHNKYSVGRQATNLNSMKFTRLVSVLLCLLFWNTHASLSVPEAPHSKRGLLIPRNAQEHRRHKTYLSSTQNIIQQAVPQFRLTSTVAVINVLINSLRTDSSIPWPLRLPRLLWEMAIALLAHGCAMHHSPVFCISFAFVTFSTAIIDLFMWTPLFAALASFQPCTTKRWRFEDARTCSTIELRGHVFAMIQCMVTGFVYLITAITAYAILRAQRDEQHIEREIVVQRHMTY